MNATLEELRIIPKDCAEIGIPKLPCDSGETGTFTGTPSLGIAYVPVQKFKDLYKDDYGLMAGTLFKELDLPFMGIGGTLV